MKKIEAPSVILDAAKAYGTTPRRAKDTEHNVFCWIAFESKESAIITYDDEPNVLVSAGNHIGRYV